MDKLLSWLNDFERQLANSQEICNCAQQNAARMQQQMENINRQSIERLRRNIEDLLQDNILIAELYKRIRQPLARRGWYIAGSLCSDQYQSLELALSNGWEPEIEDFLCEHIREQVVYIEKNAIKTWRKRAAIIEDSFRAHSEKRYALSIPAFLAQADGVAVDLLGAFLFTDRRGNNIKKAVSKAIKDRTKECPLSVSFLGLLLESSGLRDDTDTRDKLEKEGNIISPLNRHGVLHGLDCQYNTEANSLRCIALIDYLEWVTESISNTNSNP